MVIAGEAQGWELRAVSSVTFTIQKIEKWMHACLICSWISLVLCKDPNPENGTVRFQASMKATKAVPNRQASTPFQVSLTVSGWQLELITEETYSLLVPPLLQILLSFSKIIIYLHPPKLQLLSTKGKKRFFNSGASRQRHNFLSFVYSP